MTRSALLALAPLAGCARLSASNECHDTLQECIAGISKADEALKTCTAELRLASDTMERAATAMRVDRDIARRTAGILADGGTGDLYMGGGHFIAPPGSTGTFTITPQVGHVTFNGADGGTR